MYLGERKMDLTVQSERYKGEFDRNFILFLAGAINYRF